MKKFLVFALIIAVCIFGFVACDEETSNNGSNNQENNAANDGDTNNAQSDTNNSKKELSYGDTFTFDDLEITFEPSYEFVTIENEFNDNFGKDVIKFPFTIKNIKDESHGLNFIYCKAYNPAGTSANTAELYFDDSFFNAGNMRSGAIQNTFYYIIYEGDGDYFVEFNDFLSKTEIKLPVTK